MAVPEVNITIEQGTDYTQDFIIKNSNQSAFNLTGYTSQAKIRKFPDATASSSFNVGITSSLGKVTISMANTVTSSLNSGRHYYDIVIVSTATSSITKVFTGMAMVNASVTV